MPKKITTFLNNPVVSARTLLVIARRDGFLASWRRISSILFDSIFASAAYEKLVKFRLYSGKNRKLASVVFSATNEISRAAEKTGTVQEFQEKKIIASYDAKKEAEEKRLLVREEALDKWKGKKVVFILPVEGVGGGANVVITEARSMKSFGVDVRLLNVYQYKHTFEKCYPQLDISVVWAENEKTIPGVINGFDAAVATANYSVKWLLPLTNVSRPSLAYYSQDYEPFFYPEGSQEFHQAIESYTLIPKMKLITKTDWNRQVIEKNHDKKVEVVGPSFEAKYFYPRLRRTQPGKCLRIAAMIRPSSARRAAEMTMEILSKIKIKYGKKIDIVIFGLSHGQLKNVELNKDFCFDNFGILDSGALSRLLNETDIFVDFSAYQAMGLTAMEAMATGVATIVPEAGGANSFARDRENALIVDSSDQEICERSLSELIGNQELREKISLRAVSDMQKFHPDFSAEKILSVLFD